MQKLLVLALAAAACGGPGKPVCYNEACSTGSATFQQCSDGQSCWYTTADSKRFSCKSCKDCAAALASINSWCASAGPPPGSGTTCSALLNGAASGTTAATTKLQALATCAAQQCGNQKNASTYPGPCATDPNSAACTTCFNNIEVNSLVQFTDMMGNPIACQPATASNCMACGNEVADCFLDCNNNDDCATLNCTMTGLPATCQSSGSCGC